MHNRYDWRQGRTLNAVHFQQGNTIWSIEFSNGTSYYVDIYVRPCPASPSRCNGLISIAFDGTAIVQAGKCKTIKFPVGILRCVPLRPGII